MAPVVNARASASSFMMILTQGIKMGVTAAVNPSIKYAVTCNVNFYHS